VKSGIFHSYILKKPLFLFKDMVALAKLHARVAYRPKTPSRKESSGSNKSR